LDQEAEKMVVAAGTAQHAEAVRAFIEKRVPNYSRPPNASEEAT
jgi:2-(1,2-epoxy-1,2-dihydrophenyl)acetyl-CoA isomerase